MCMKRIDIYTKRCGQLTSNKTYFADIWLSSVKIDEESMAAGVYYCGPLKKIHKVFCLATLEMLMKDEPVGSYLFMKITPRVPGGRPLLSIGYK